MVSDNNMRRVHVWITGRVQGVFFRANTRNEAVKLDLKGWVKNLPDERVEALFEGDDKATNHMLRFCRRGPFGSKVDDVEIVEEKYKGEFESFEIRY